MNVIHTHWRPPNSPDETGSLLFWAETAELPQLEKMDRRTKKTRIHPFCLSASAMQELLSQQFGVDANGELSCAELFLPMGRFGPLPSPQLIHDWDLGTKQMPLLRPWLVDGIGLTLDVAFRILMALPQETMITPTLHIGTDCRFWATAATLVAEVLAQQKLLPLLTPIDERRSQYHARWMPVLDGPKDGQRISQLLAAMPPLCRANADTEYEAPPPRLLVETFLNEMTDQVARQVDGTHDLSHLSTEPAHNWLRALFNGSPVVQGSAAQLRHLHNSHNVWLRNLYMAGDNHFRIAFRLEAPLQIAQAENATSNGRSNGLATRTNQDQPRTDGSWPLHFLLQARDDPSLLVTADQVWNSQGNVLNLLDRQFTQPQEKLLAGLGYAARLFKPLTRGLETKSPLSVALSTNEAFDFLREHAPLLEESGFGVLVPPWWNKPGTRLGVRLRMESSNSLGSGADIVSSAGVTLDSLISFKWELSIGDVPLTQEEFAALAALKSPLVQIRGQWVQLDPEQIEAAINFWEKQNQTGTVGLQEALQMGLGAEAVAGLPIEHVEYKGWLAEWMDRFTGSESMETLPQPEGLLAQLRPYQEYGYSWLTFLRRWGMGACLADDMGLGKTMQTIAMLLRDKEERGQLPGPVLLVCPTSVVTNWAKEVDQFAPALRTHIHQGPERLRGDAFQEIVTQTDMILTSYPLVRRDAAFLSQIEWFGVILDEAQNIKNPETKQAQTIRALTTQFRMALTGTPVENRLSELWSIMNFLNPGFLGTRTDFRRSFSIPIERYKDEAAVARLRRLTNPFILRRVKTDPTVIQDLPEKQEMKVFCHLVPEQATLYQAVVQEAMNRINESDGIERKGLVLGMLMQLKQICNHPAQFLHQVSGESMGDGHFAEKEGKRSGKLVRMVELLEEVIAVGERALIFTQFAEMGHLLKSYLQQQLGVPTQFLHGGTPARQRTSMIERFQEDADGPPLFILSLKAGGTGLTLTRANHVFHFDRWWNPAVEDQATDRAFRIGQKRNVQVHKFVCTGTLEEKIDEMIENKKALAESVVGSGENWLTELSTDDLQEMVTLRKRAIEE
ncbi:DEAD/DEAH box helicase [Chloroflexi bacterium TSY]|nr:DEAD/DEAH box helicase [Chloroflexi bacterium TSY]